MTHATSWNEYPVFHHAAANPHVCTRAEARKPHLTQRVWEAHGSMHLAGAAVKSLCSRLLGASADSPDRGRCQWNTGSRW